LLAAGGETQDALGKEGIPVSPTSVVGKLKFVLPYITEKLLRNHLKLLMLRLLTSGSEVGEGLERPGRDARVYNAQN